MLRIELQGQVQVTVTVERTQQGESVVLTFTETDSATECRFAFDRLTWAALVRAFQTAVPTLAAAPDDNGAERVPGQLDLTDGPAA